VRKVEIKTCYDSILLAITGSKYGLCLQHVPILFVHYFCNSALD
jgi:hypothetical protein